LLALRISRGQPDRRLNGFNLTEEESDTAEVVMSPVFGAGERFRVLHASHSDSAALAIYRPVGKQY